MATKFETVSVPDPATLPYAIPHATSRYWGGKSVTGKGSIDEITRAAIQAEMKKEPWRANRDFAESTPAATTVPSGPQRRIDLSTSAVEAIRKTAAAYRDQGKTYDFSERFAVKGPDVETLPTGGRVYMPRTPENGRMSFDPKTGARVFAGGETRTAVRPDETVYSFGGDLRPEQVLRVSASEASSRVAASSMQTDQDYLSKAFSLAGVPTAKSLGINPSMAPINVEVPAIPASPYGGRSAKSFPRIVVASTPEDPAEKRMNKALELYWLNRDRRERWASKGKNKAQFNWSRLTGPVSTYE